MTNIKYGIAPIQSRLSLVGRKPVAASRSIHRSADALPCGPIVNRMTVGVVAAEL